jgi:1-acyl-sn-glycerol-3-phosphate acyltransferase
MRLGVPVVPVVSVGAHEVLRVLNDGRATAKALGLDRLFRLKTLPLTWSFPFGLTIAGVPSFPLPKRVALRVLPAIALDGDAEDAADVERAHDLVRDTMQRGLDRLVEDREAGKV